MRPAASGLLDLLEHLEKTLWRADEHSLERFRQATTLERVAAGAGAFGHDFLDGERAAQNAAKTAILPHSSFQINGMGRMPKQGLRQGIG